MGYAGLVELCEPSMDAREAGAAAVQARTGAAFVSPYNNAAVMAGQGTVALELLEQARPDGQASSLSSVFKGYVGLGSAVVAGQGTVALELLEQARADGQAFVVGNLWVGGFWDQLSGRSRALWRWSCWSRRAHFILSAKLCLSALLQACGNTDGVA